MILDLHNDFLTELNKKDIVEYLDKNSSITKGVCAAIWTNQLINPLKVIKDRSNLLKNNLKQKYYLCIEDLWFVDKVNINEIIKLKPLYCGLCWNNKNSLCAGAYSSGGLTLKGKYIIKRLQDDCVMMDTAHMNRQSFYDYAKFTTKPIFCSHTGFNDVVKDKRNLTKNQLKLIVESSGLVGLYFVGKYISYNNCSVLDIVKNIDYFVNNFGIKNLSIGTDFYGTKDLPSGIKNYQDLAKIKQKLANFGYKNSEIDAIFVNNAKNFIKKEISY